MMMMMMMMLQSVYLNDRRSVVMELDKNCNKKTPPLAAGLSGLLFTKLGNLQLTSVQAGQKNRTDYVLYKCNKNPPLLKLLSHTSLAEAYLLECDHSLFDSHWRW